MDAKSVHVRFKEGQPCLVDEEERAIEDADRFLSAAHVRGLSPCTVRAYAFDLVVLYRWLHQTGRTLQALQSSDLLDFVGALREKGFQAHTINRRLTTCRLLFRFVTNRELASDYRSGMSRGYPSGRRRDCTLGIHKLRPAVQRKFRVRAPRKVVEPLTAPQVRAFLRTFRRYRDLAIVHLMLLCGLRSQEVLRIELNDIRHDEPGILVRGKGNQQRRLPLPPIVIEMISDYLRLERPLVCHGALFVVLQGKRRGYPMSLAGLRSLFRHRRRNRFLAMAHAHRFRHTFGADMARAGVRLPILQRMMGHAYPSTTLGYIHLSMDDVADEYRRALRAIERRYGTA